VLQAIDTPVPGTVPSRTSGATDCTIVGLDEYRAAYAAEIAKRGLLVRGATADNAARARRAS